MSITDIVSLLQSYIREEFIAVSEVKENTIRVRFIDGSLVNIIVMN